MTEHNRHFFNPSIERSEVIEMKFKPDKNQLRNLSDLYDDLERNHWQRYGEMELVLLGMMILKNGACIPDVCKRIGADDFINNQYKAIFKAIVDIYENGNPPSIPLIAEWLRSHGYYFFDGAKKPVEIPSYIDSAQCVDYQEIMNVGQCAFTDAYADSYAEKLADASLERKSLKAQIQNIQNSFDDTITPQEKWNLLQKSIDEFSAKITAQKSSNIADFLTGKDGDITKSELYLGFEKFDKFAERKSGFENWDAVQFFPPSVQVIGALTGAGKTTFCLQVLSHFAKHVINEKIGEKCLYFSTEMEPYDLNCKLLANLHFQACRANNSAFQSFSAFDIKRGLFQKIIDRAIENPLASEPFYKNSKIFKEEVIPDAQEHFRNLEFFKCENKTIDDIFRMIRPYLQEFKAPIVCIDYLQMLSPADSKLPESENLKIAMRKLKAFSTKYDVLFFVISALNRDNYALGGLQAFRGSSAIEYGCDVAYNLSIDFDPQTESFDSAARKSPRNVKLKCLKNRLGNLYEINFDYFSRSDFFEPAAPDEIAENGADNEESDAAPSYNVAR